MREGVVAKPLQLGLAQAIRSLLIRQIPVNLPEGFGSLPTERLAPTVRHIGRRRACQPLCYDDVESLRQSRLPR